jgi:fused signal recognition particle receptor
MFGKLKDKLKSWVTKSKEDIEEKAEKVETPKEEKPKKEVKAKSKKQLEKELKKVKKEIKKEVSDAIEEKIKRAEEQDIPTVPEKFDNAIQGYKPDLDKIKKDGAEILSEKSAEEVKEVLEEKQGETAKDVSDRIDEIEEEAQEPEKKSFFSKVKSKFAYKITEEEFDNIFDDLEMLLLENNVALEVTEDIKSKLSKKLVDKEIKQEDLEKEIKSELKATLNEILIDPDNPLDIIKLKEKAGEPFVILFFGINGTGKTTTIAKLTNLLQKNKLSVVLAAADTFRAASIEQIQIHADKLKVPLIKHDYGSDPSAVGFDAIKYAKKNKIDVVLIDTAGRMHTKTNLLAEMEKIVRVTNPDLKIFVAESIAGNDATEQAKSFNEMIEVDGSILSKADIDEKGGTVISVSHTTHKPIFYLGTGQEYKDIQLFDKQKFINDLGLD